MLYVGIFFVSVGLYSILEEFYDIKSFSKTKTLNKKQEINLDGYLKVKVMIGLFTAIVGVYSIINYFYY